MGEWNPEIAISVSELLEAGTRILKCKAPDPEILGRQTLGGFTGFTGSLNDCLL